MKVIRLSENVYEVKPSLWCWSSKKSLVKGLQEIQGYGKTIGAVVCITVSYIVVTS